jgi:hypothetical protein
MSADRSEYEALLETSERALTQQRSPALLFDRARALDGLGRNEEAERAYLELLHADASHFDGLTALGRLLLASGQKRGARLTLARAAAVHPENSAAHSNLATLLCDDDLPGARRHYAEALRLDPSNRGAHRGLAILLLRAGDSEAAQRHAQLGFQGQADPWPYRGAGRPVSVVFVQSALGGNVPLDQFLDDRVFLKWTLAPEFFDREVGLPAHDLVLNGIGDADLCGAALEAAAVALSQTRAPVINPPARVRMTGRAANAARLAKLPGVVTARTQEWSREMLTAPSAPSALAAAGFRFPLLLRSPGFHTGEHFEKVADPSALHKVASRLPGATQLVMEFVDTRGADGNFRKYRVMMIGGELFPLHLAVSQSWKVHYFSADAEQYRAVDEAFLNDMPSVLGSARLRTLVDIRDELALDYGGIDFGLDDTGNVVIFEANATMVILPPSVEPAWAYRVGPIERARQAVRQMLLTRAQSAVVSAR